MSDDERRRVADAMAAARSSNGALLGRLPWLAAKPTAAAQLVCVGKIKSNGVSQSLFIDRSEWPPRTGQQLNGALTQQQPRPQQTRAAAIAAAAAAAAAGAAPKVIYITPAVASPPRSQTVIQRAPAHQLQQQNTAVMMLQEQQTSGGDEVTVVDVDSAAATVPRPSSKRTFEQTHDHDSQQQQVRVQLRSIANTIAKAAMIATDADTATDASSTAPTVLPPGSSVLLPGWASKNGGAVDGRPQLRPLLPRTVDLSPARAMNNVITIVPTTTSSVLPLSRRPVTSSVLIPSNLSPSVTAVPPSRVASSLGTCSGTTNAERGSLSTAGEVPCCEGAARQPVEVVECRHVHAAACVSSRSQQLLKRIRLIECEMTSSSADSSAPAAQSATPLYINVVPLQQSSNVDDDRPPPAQRPDSVHDDDDDDDDEQPPPQMLEALRLRRNPSRRPTRRRGGTAKTSSTPSDARPTAGDDRAAAVSTSRHRSHVLAPAAAAAAASSAGGARLVTMKLVSRSTQ